MTDGVFPDRLTQLRARWDADPASRIFLQLAEEYRHLGRVQDALAVLDKGLKEHPGYLSALVAKGRCHLELGEGDDARVVLERVVKQDATQMVANKLLVRAYLETGDPVKARERLDLYSLLNDSDSEIEDLRRRIRQLEKPAQPERPVQSVRPGPAADPSRAPDIFDLDLPPPHRGGDEIFELAPAVPARPADAPAFRSETIPLETSPAPAPAAVAEPEEEMEEADVLFAGLGTRDSRRRYLDALGAEGLFSFELSAAPARFAPPPLSLVAEPFAPAPAAVEPAAPPAAAAAAPPAEEASWLDEAAASEPVSPPARTPEPLMPAIFAPEPPAPVFEPEATTAEELWSDEPRAFDVADLAPPPLPPVIAPEPPQPVFAPEPESVPEKEPEPAAEPRAAVATATLGELYFRQGHYAEAERIFREVLLREPDSAVARAGLERLAALGPQPETPRLDARRLLAGYRRDAARPADAEARSRKIFLLQRYLERLRQGSPHDVP